MASSALGQRRQRGLMKRKMSRSTFLLGVGGCGPEYSRTQRQRITRPSQKRPMGGRRRPPALHVGPDARNQAEDKGSGHQLHFWVHGHTAVRARAGEPSEWSKRDDPQVRLERDVAEL